ncbi:MAG: hypothetical protein MJZ75_01495, partial [Paludibacteraceae bacterium]|nr:hypothetical protein [Paludibacteraceae bacterium]
DDDFEKRVALLANEAKMKKENSKYRTEATIKSIVSNVIRPLIADLDVSVKALAPFYSSQEVSLIKLSKSGTATKLDIDDILNDNQNLVGLKRLRIRIVLSEPTDLLTNKAAEMLDVLSLFGPKKYVFQIGNTSYTYEYYTLLDEKDRKQFVKTIQDLLYDAIKMKVEKK